MTFEFTSFIVTLYITHERVALLYLCKEKVDTVKDTAVIMQLYFNSATNLNPTVLYLPCERRPSPRKSVRQEFLLAYHEPPRMLRAEKLSKQKLKNIFLSIEKSRFRIYIKLLPSYGGDWEQYYEIRMEWKK